MNIEKEFYKKLSIDKIQIRFNKNPIRMKQFLSFLTVPVMRSHDHFGHENGWTLLENEKTFLVVGGGVINNVEYLNTLQFGDRLHNRYNNLVNPFYLWDILTEEGKRFFVDYFEVDISFIEHEISKKIERFEADLLALKTLQDGIAQERLLLANCGKISLQVDKK